MRKSKFTDSQIMDTPDLETHIKIPISSATTAPFAMINLTSNYGKVLNKCKGSKPSGCGYTITSGPNRALGGYPQDNG